MKINKLIYKKKKKILNNFIKMNSHNHYGNKYYFISIQIIENINND